MSKFGGAVAAALDVLLPRQCSMCDRHVAQGALCPACFARLSFVNPPVCSGCGAPLGVSQARSRSCASCRAKRPPWAEARAALRYDEWSKRLILPLKYADRTENAQVLASFMTRAGGALAAAADWIVPVPLHRWRLMGRRYNQAALLARHVGRAAGRPVLLDGLRRVRATRPLMSLTPERRVAELAAAIAIKPSRAAMLVDSRVLLIDDVLTSGATAEACTAALLRAGVLRVDVLAAARAFSDTDYADRRREPDE